MPSLPESRRVLIVDAHQDTRDLYELALRPAGYAVDHAADGREALTQALRTRPTVVITETHLPGIDGFLLCKQLRAEPATHGIAIVVLTAEARPASLARAREAGADVVLTKPCLPHLLVTYVDALRPPIPAAEHASADGDRSGANATVFTGSSPRTIALEPGTDGPPVTSASGPPSPLGASSFDVGLVLRSRTYLRSA